MKEEKMRILKLLNDKRITPEEAAQLLEALDKTLPASGAIPAPGKYLKIRVYEGNLNEPKVNINIPLAWVKGMGPFILPHLEKKFKAKGFDFNAQEIMARIATGQTQKIVDVKDGNDKVEISIE